MILHSRTISIVTNTTRDTEAFLKHANFNSKIQPSRSVQILSA